MKQNTPPKKSEDIIKVEVDTTKVRKPTAPQRSASFNDKRNKRRRTRNNIKVEDQKENLDG